MLFQYELETDEVPSVDAAQSIVRTYFAPIEGGLMSVMLDGEEYSCEVINGVWQVAKA